MKNLKNLEIKKLEKSEVEITGEISPEALEKYRAAALKKVSANIEIAGFRKGHVPEDMLIKKVGETVLLEEMAQKTLEEFYPKIVEENKIEAIGYPAVTITKLAADNPLGFKIVTTVMPEISLADYKKIAKEELMGEEKIEATEKEVEDLILEIRKQSQITNNQQIPEVEGDKEKVKKETPKEEDLPELNDEFVKKIGDFKNVEDFKAKLKENIGLEKEHKAKEAKKMTMVEKIISQSKLELPEIVLNSELEKMMQQFQGDIAKMGLKFDEYLKHIKKTEEDLRKEWVTDAEKRGKWQLILNKIAEEEKLEPNKKEIEEESKKILEQYKDANPENVKIYVVSALANKKVFEFLEKQK